LKIGLNNKNTERNNTNSKYSTAGSILDFEILNKNPTGILTNKKTEKGLKNYAKPTLNSGLGILNTRSSNLRKTQESLSNTVRDRYAYHRSKSDKNRKIGSKLSIKSSYSFKLNTNKQFSK